jgi:hypothetical protein
LVVGDTRSRAFAWADPEVRLGVTRQCASGGRQDQDRLDCRRRIASFPIAPEEKGEAGVNDPRSPMKAGQNKGEATEVMLRDLETKLVAYLDQWRRELGLKNIDRDKLRPATFEHEARRR